MQLPLSFNHRHYIYRCFNSICILLSNRITKPLRQLRTQAINISKGDYSKQTSVSTKDEIGELSHTFNNMSSEIQREYRGTFNSKKYRDSLINSMIEGVLGLNDKKGSYSFK